jgi:AcrR family transcriptional regulator
VARTYVSKLRAEQAEATRLRVIEAVATVLGRDLSEFTVPNVAAEAEVSLATVQRLFRTKRDLLDGLARHYAATTGSGYGSDRPWDLVDFLTKLPEVFAKTATVPPALRSAVTSETFQQFRRERRGSRLRPMEEALEPYKSGFQDGEARRLRDLFTVLTSSAGLFAFTDLTGSTPEEAAATVAWTIRRLLGLDQRTGGQRST